MLRTSGLICLNWYDWNRALVQMHGTPLPSSGLICLNWYDWNIFHLYRFCMVTCVGIDLPELIRLKLSPRSISRVINASVGIDLPELIRLKLHTYYLYHNLIVRSGLICLNWYDWNYINSISLWILCNAVGIDLPELIRLKLVRTKCALYCFVCCRDWSARIDTIETIPLYVVSPTTIPRRDWSAWIDTIETLWNKIFSTSLYRVGIDLPDLFKRKFLVMPE